MAIWALKFGCLSHRNVSGGLEEISLASTAPIHAANMQIILVISCGVAVI